MNRFNFLQRFYRSAPKAMLVLTLAPAVLILSAMEPSARNAGAAITPHQAIAVIVEGEVGENDFRISDMGSDLLYDASVPSVAYNSENDVFLVVWSGDDNGAGLADDEFEIFGRLIDAASGAVHGGDFRISEMAADGNETYDAFVPAVSYNSQDNEFLVVWRGDDGGAMGDDEFEIFGQRLDASDGTEIGGDFRISAMGDDGDPDWGAFAPAVAYNSADNEYLVAWYGDDETLMIPDNAFEIVGQRIDAASGALIGDPLRISEGVSEDPDYDAYFPAIAYNSVDNEYLVGWQSDDASDVANDEYEIFGRRLQANSGTAIGGDIRLSDMGPDGSALFDATQPDVTYSSEENAYLVVWRGNDDSLTSGEFEIFGQQVNASSGTEIGDDFRISNMGPDNSAFTDYDAAEPTVTYDSAENAYLVAWSSDHDLPGLVEDELEIFGQRLEAHTGTEIGGQLRISEMGPDGDQFYDARFPALASSGGWFLVVWEGDTNGGGLVEDEMEIFGQRLEAADGSDIGSDFRISDMGSDDMYDAYLPAAAYNSSENEYLVVWWGNDNSGDLVADESEVFGQRIDAATGAEIGGDFRISEMGPIGNGVYAGTDPAAAYNSVDNEYLVVWEGADDDAGLAPDESEIFGQRIDGATGTQIGSNFRISNMNIGNDDNDDWRAFSPAVAYNNAENEFLAVWHGTDEDGEQTPGELEIFGQRIDAATGDEIGADFRISEMGPDDDPIYDAFYPALAYNSADNAYLVVWFGDDNAGDLVDNELEIFGQRIDGSSGMAMGGNFRISDMGPNGDAEYDAQDPSVAYDSSDNEYLVVWSGDDNSPDLVNDENEIFGQRIDAGSGAEIGGDFRISVMGPIGSISYGAFVPTVAYDGVADQYLVAWYGADDSGDLVVGELEIFGQRINAAAGTAIGGHVRLSDMGPDGEADYDARAPVLTYNSVDNQFLVVWAGDDNARDLVEGESEIFGQRYTPEPAPSQTTILSDAPDPSAPGEPFTVSVSVTSTKGLPTGTVTITVNNSLESCTAPLAAGLASCSLELAVSGDYTLTAAYPGDGAFTASSDTETHSISLVGNHRLYLPIIRRN